MQVCIGSLPKNVRWTFFASQRSVMYKIEPAQGKFHQIRVLLSHGGAPILGDIKYGDKGFFKNKIALHAAELEIESRKMKYTAELPLEEYWDNFR